MSSLALLEENTLAAGALNSRANSSLAYMFRPLASEHVDEILELQNRVAGDNTIQRDDDYLFNHFNNANSAIGIFHENELVGQALITLNTIECQGLTKTFSAVNDKSSLAQSTISMLLVDPAHAGKGLCAMLLDLWQNVSEMQGADVLHARVKVTNERAYSRFNNLGMQDVKHAPSPDDSSRIVAYMYKAI